MTNNISTMSARSPLACIIAAVHESNPILQTAVKSHRVSTIFPTTLNVAEAEQAGLYPGYYLRAGDGNNYWIGKTMEEGRCNLGKVADRVLKASFNFDYDIEYSFGHVVGGGSPWSNMSDLDEMV